MKTSLVAPVLVLAVTVALAIEWLLSYPQPAAQSITPPELPRASASDHGVLLAALLDNNLWDQNRGKLVGANTDPGGESGYASDDGGDAAIADPAWQLLGVSMRGKTPLAVISIDKDIKSFFQGEELPGGAEIVQIVPYGVHVVNQGKNEYVYLFGKK